MSAAPRLVDLPTPLSVAFDDLVDDQVTGVVESSFLGTEGDRTTCGLTYDQLAELEVLVLAIRGQLSRYAGAQLEAARGVLLAAVGEWQE